MTRTRVTLRGDDAEQFEDIQEEIAGVRNESPPSDAETFRLMM